MLTDKPFKTIDEQIKLLKQRNLIFLNEETARNALKRYGYYEIINGYKDHFLIEDGNDDKGFKPGTTFEHIYALYTLDKDISRDLLRALEDFEQTFKQALAYVISEEISPLDTRFCAISHFNTGRIYGHDRHGNSKCDRSRLIRKFNFLKSSDNEPFKHYRERHSNIPPWIMVKGLSFGQLLYWYRLSKPFIRHQILFRLLGNDILMSNENDINILSQLFGDVFALYLTYRNLTAHGGRVFNHRSRRHRIRINSILYNSYKINVSQRSLNRGEYRSSIGIVIYTLRQFDNYRPAALAYEWIIAELKVYLQKYPEDRQYLINSMELDVFSSLDDDLK